MSEERDFLNRLLMCVTNEEIPKDPPRYLFAGRIDSVDEYEYQSWMHEIYLSDYQPPDKALCLIQITLVDGTNILLTKQNFNGGKCDCCSDSGKLYDSPVDRVHVYRIL